MAPSSLPSPSATLPQQQPPRPSDPLDPTRAEADAARLSLSTPPPRPTISDAWASVKAGDFLAVHEAPCSRSGFLTGIGSGAAVGALRFVLGSGVPRAANWAVGAGVLGAVVQYEYCQAKRRGEREKMKRVVEVYDRKQAEVRRGEEERAQVRRAQHLRQEEEAKQKTGQSWWKVW